MGERYVLTTPRTPLHAPPRDPEVVAAAAQMIQNSQRMKQAKEDPRHVRHLSRQGGTASIWMSKKERYPGADVATEIQDSNMQPTTAGGMGSPQYQTPPMTQGTGVPSQGNW